MARLLLAASLAVHVLLHVGAVVGCARILLAGRLESRGRLERARAVARRGGFVMAGASLATVASWPALAATLPHPLRRAFFVDSELALPVAAAGMLVTVLAGFVGLLAGLTGKPRPSGWLAAALLLVGLAAGLSSAWLLWRS
jgi:hypothetical protein